MPTPDPLPQVRVRGILLTRNMQLRFQTLPSLIGTKTRNYRRTYLDLAVFCNTSSGGSVTFNVLRVNPSSGSQTALVQGHTVTFSGKEIKTTRIEMESTMDGYWVYSLHVDSVTTGVIYLIGIWLGIDEHYDYGSDTLLN